MADYYAHPSAVIDEGAEIGEDTKIWHFCHVMAGARIGVGCVLGQNVFVANGVIIGNNVKIQNNVSIYDGVTIEDDVFIGPSVVFTNVRYPRAFIDQKDRYQATLIKKGATIGANATILCDIIIGEYAMIGAGSTVTKYIPPHAMVIGSPACIVCRVDKSGHPLLAELMDEIRKE